MTLGDLELAVLRVVRALGRATAGEVYQAVRSERPIAYTSVTTTLYRLVGKDLIAVRRAGERRTEYRVKEGRAYRRAMATMLDRVVDTFGGEAVSYVLENPGNLTDEDVDDLRTRVRRQRRREKARD